LYFAVEPLFLGKIWALSIPEKTGIDHFKTLLVVQFLRFVLNSGKPHWLAMAFAPHALSPNSHAGHGTGFKPPSSIEGVAVLGAVEQGGSQEGKCAEPHARNKSAGSAQLVP
jgi:hypothetical protein